MSTEKSSSFERESGMEAQGQHIFRPGEKVVWTKNRVFADRERHGLLSPDEQHTTEPYGEGPFEVVAVEDIPEGERKAAGHSQWVTISTSKGEQKFSGRWLEPHAV